MAASTPLHGRVALVTGGSRGIGAAIARELAAAGATLALNYRSDEGAARDVAAGLGGGTSIWRADV
jgi:3-oxoacyl-[acyl-carrier protein] reductase